MKKLGLVLQGLLVLTIMSCQNITPKEEVTYYYDIDSLVTAQQRMLLDISAGLSKNVQIATDSSSSRVQPDSLGWADELNIFKEASINEPILQGLYEVSVYDDDKSNLKIKEFRAMSGQDLKVRYLRIYYLNDLSMIRRLESVYEEENPVYNSKRELSMKFEDVKGQPALTNYTIKGVQNMILQDAVSFNIEADVTFN